MKLIVKQQYLTDVQDLCAELDIPITLFEKVSKSQESACLYYEPSYSKTCLLMASKGVIVLTNAPRQEVEDLIQAYGRCPVELVRNREELVNHIKYYQNNPAELQADQNELKVWAKQNKAHIRGILDKKPLVSVIIPVFNQQDFIQQAIDSVLQQTFRDYELIIVDDGSTDDTASILASLPKLQHIHILRNPENWGIGPARNVGVEAAEGKLITFLSGDDLWKPDFLKRMIEELRDSNIVFCNYDIIMENGQFRATQDYGVLRQYKQPITFDKETFASMIETRAKEFDMFVNYSCILGKKECFIKENGFSHWKFGEDFYHLLKMCSKVRFRFIPEALVKYRSYDKNTTTRTLHKSRQNCQDIFTAIEREKLEELDAKEPKHTFSNLSKKPLVSVVIPTYNRAKEGYLQKAVNSVIAQTYKKTEIIVVDDGSIDNTRSEMIKLSKINPKVSIKYIYKTNGGCASALNAGVKVAKGQLICWLSSDDWYDFEENTLIEKSVKTHLENPTVGMTYCDYTVSEPEISWTYNSFEGKTRRESFEKLLEVCYICGSTMMINRDVFYTTGFFNENFKYGQDYEYYFRIMTLFDIKKVHYTKKPMLNYFSKPNHECLGENISNKQHDNEGEPIRERFKLMMDRKRPKCCAMLCVKDEEEIIDQCLNDLSMYIDYVVVFDDGSTDRTPELVKKWKKVVKYHYSPHKGNKRTEGADRQKLFDMACETDADWFLFIDADEVFEDRFKTQIFQEMKTEGVNLFFYHEINFWRNPIYHRIDEKYNIGWFGRLFRRMPGLKYGSATEHCGGIPQNIPNTSPWYNGSPTQRRSPIRVRHYGFSTEARLLNKFRSLWQREKHERPLKQCHEYYDRLLDESTLALKKYYERPYYLKSNMPDPPEEFITGKEFGFSEEMSKELGMAQKGKGVYRGEGL